MVGLSAHFVLTVALAFPTFVALLLAYRVLRWARSKNIVSAILALVAAAAAAGVLVLGAGYALLASPSYGSTSLDLRSPPSPFLLLRSIGAWRWRSWDEQERWTFRTAIDRRLGRSWDGAVWLWLGLAVLGLVLWVGLGLFSPRWSGFGLAIAAVFAVLAVVMGSIQDALNTSGTEIEEFPQVADSAFEVTPSEEVLRSY